MARQIVKQPDGLYSVWSTIVDDFVYTDCTKEDLIQGFLEEEKERIIDSVNRQLNDIEQGNTNQFTKTYGECLKRIKELHGED